MNSSQAGIAEAGAGAGDVEQSAGNRRDDAELACWREPKRRSRCPARRAQSLTRIPLQRFRARRLPAALTVSWRRSALTARERNQTGQGREVEDWTIGFDYSRSVGKFDAPIGTKTDNFLWRGRFDSAAILESQSVVESTKRRPPNSAPKPS